MLSDVELCASSTQDGLDPVGIAGRIAAKEAVFKLFPRRRATGALAHHRKS